MTLTSRTCFDAPASSESCESSLKCPQREGSRQELHVKLTQRWPLSKPFLNYKQIYNALGDVGECLGDGGDIWAGAITDVR